MSVKAGEGETSNMLVSLAVGAENGHVCAYVYLHICIPGTHPGSLGLKMPYADRGSSHNMNHLVTTAELEMSYLISVPHASVPLHHLHLWQWSQREDLIKERS